MLLPRISLALHLFIVGSVLITGCDSQKPVPDHPPVCIDARACSQLEMLDAEIDEDEETDVDEYTDSVPGGRAGTTRNVWFQFRKNLDGELSNNITLKVWDYSKNPSGFAALMSAQGDPADDGNYLYADILPTSFNRSKPTKTYLTKKPGPALYKKLRMKPGNYVVQITDGAYGADSWHAFTVGTTDLRFGTAASDYTDNRDGLTNAAGRLKVSVWNGPYKPETVGLMILDDDGQTHQLAHYASAASEAIYAPIRFNTASASTMKKSCMYSLPVGNYVLVYAESTNAIADGQALGFQKFSVTSGSKYPFIKIALTAN